MPSFITPYLVWIKIGLVAALVAGASWLAWDYRGAKTEHEVRDAVVDANREAQRAIDRERLTTDFYRELADAKYASLLQSIARIQVTKGEIRTIVGQEIRDNAKFYNQPIPDRGYEQWKRARSLMEASPAPSVPASSPQR